MAVFVALVSVPSAFGQTAPDFEDVPDGHVAGPAIGWAAENGITVGVGDNRFGVGQTLTRYQMVTFLCRAYDPDGCRSGASGSDRFDDVPADHWADLSVGWAVDRGITRGVSATEFGGSQTLTREQMITFLYRAEGSPTGGSLGSSVYQDVPADRSQWANLPIGWAYDEGVTGGIAAGIFGFGANVSREEMVLFLCRALAPDTCQPSQQPLPSSVVPTSPLAALYYAAGGPNWTDSANWLTDAPMGEWYGVVTDARGRVTGLHLSNNGLSGTIPPELGNLTNLTELWLGLNRLSGEIPPQLANLTNLTELWLGLNRLSGEIPPQLANLTNLTFLGLSGNQLSGTIPPQLANLTNLTDLNLFDNQLSGEIPPELGNLTNLKNLRLSGNQLNGTIPPQLANLTNLTDLNLFDNQLRGEIPPELGNLTNLMDLRLQRNRLSGEIPRWLADLATLGRLYLSHNRLSGEIPPELGNLTNLTSLWIDNNRLSGEIPVELGNLTNLRILRLNGNQLGGEIPPWLANLTNLTLLRLGGNQLSGEIPPELGNLTNLTDLNLANNRLSGEIPVELAKLANLRSLHLQSNQFRGEIPPWLANLTNLTHLRLSLNRLSGEIPPQLANLTNLTELWLQENQLSGEIPPDLGNLANLTDLRLGANQLGGEIPPELGALVNLRNLWLHNNRLHGEIPPELGTLVNLRDLWLHNNRLRGEIPPELIALASRGEMWLSSDLLRRRIPDGPVPVRVAPGAGTPSGGRSRVALTEAFDGRRFDLPIEIGAYPVGPSGGPGSGLFVAEQEGRILLLDPDGPGAAELLDIRNRVSRAGEQDGLLTVALDPEFETNGHLWLYYSAHDAPVSRLSRFQAAPDDRRRVDPGSEFVVMEINQVSTSHHGGAIRFGPDGMLYLGLGDGSPAGDQEGHGQNRRTLLGSVIRIDVSEASAASPYAIPHDNPFVDGEGARPEIWAYGFRNPWRMAFDPTTGALWAGDVGQSHVEEINIIKAGGNYGWNRLEGTLCFRPTIGCDSGDAVRPVAVYGHNLGCAVTGGVVYRGSAIPALAGHYLFADFCSGRLWALPPDRGHAIEIAVSPRMVSSFGVDADGEVYAVTFYGAVLRIMPATQPAQ